MSDVNATNDGADATKAPETATAGEQGNGDAGTAASLDYSAGESQALGAGSSAGSADSIDQGNAAAGANQSSQQCLDSGESTSAGELPNDADTSRVAPVTPAAMVSRVEAAALHAFNVGNTNEHNLMAWLHTHLAGAKAAAAGAGGLEGLSPEAKSILADLKNAL